MNPIVIRNIVFGIITILWLIQIGWIIWDMIKDKKAHRGWEGGLLPLFVLLALLLMSAIWIFSIPL